METADIFKIFKSIKLFMKMKSVSHITGEKKNPKWTFWRTILCWHKNFWRRIVKQFALLRCLTNSEILWDSWSKMMSYCCPLRIPGDIVSKAWRDTVNSGKFTDLWLRTCSWLFLCCGLRKMGGAHYVWMLILSRASDRGAEINSWRWYKKVTFLLA